MGFDRIDLHFHESVPAMLSAALKCHPSTFTTSPGVTDALPL